uniref:Fibrinogen C-terminal domain-containing protein n=1 Tax=Syphacia muris TaxID=451379 RepID=A0A0N5AW83_9BILA
MQYPHISSGYHQVHDCSCPGGKNCKNTVLCDMKTEGGGWTVIMQRLNTKLSFNKTREQYENGFQIDKDNFWIGNIKN